MNPLVRDLYKRFLVVGRDYPPGLDFVRAKAKKAFFDNKDITDVNELKRAVIKGRWMVKEMIGVVQLKKYRSLKARYYPDPDEVKENGSPLHPQAHPRSTSSTEPTDAPQP